MTIFKGRKIIWDKELLGRLYFIQNLSSYEIATRLGVSSSTVYWAMKKLGITRRNQSQCQLIKYASINREEIIKLYQDGKGIPTISKQLKLGEGLIKDTLVRAKIPMRSRYDPIYRIAKGSASHAWKGGRIRKSNGYISVYSLGHPYADSVGYVCEHRLVIEQKLGRYLLPSEKVHHLNGIKDDNRLENLKLVSRTDHTIYTELCSHCELRKEIRLLRWQIMELGKQLQGKLFNNEIGTVL